MKKNILFLFFILLHYICHLVNAKPIRVGVAGMTHDHINQVFDYIGKQQDVEIVGFAEPNKDGDAFAEKSQSSETLWFPIGGINPTKKS
jgi:hypothetical protein